MEALWVVLEGGGDFPFQGRCSRESIGVGAGSCPGSTRPTSCPLRAALGSVPCCPGGHSVKGLCRVGQGQSECQWGRCLLVCRMENLFINRFMHMFQSSWSDFADFEKIFVKISNTISGECTHPFPGVSHGAGEICLGPGKGRPTPAPTWQLAPPHQPGLHPCHSPRSFPVVPLPPRAFPSLGTQG